MIVIIYMSKILVRYYENQFPEEKDIVWGRVTRITEIGIDVVLLEYNGITAFLNFRDASKRSKLIKIKQEIKQNTEYTFTVINVNPDKNYVELSKRYQDQELDDEFILYYKSYKMCMSILSSYFWKSQLNTSEEQENFMTKTYWKYEPSELFEVLKNIQMNKLICGECFDITLDEATIFDETIRGYLKELICDIVCELKLISYNPIGVSKIQTALSHLEVLLDTTITLKTPPVYEFRTNNIKEREYDDICSKLKYDIMQTKLDGVVIQNIEFNKLSK